MLVGGNGVGVGVGVGIGVGVGTGVGVGVGVAVAVAVGTGVDVGATSALLPHADASEIARDAAATRLVRTGVMATIIF